MKVNVRMLVAQSCLTLCNPMDCSPQDPLSMSCHFLLQGIFLAQGSNLGLLHCRQILYHLSHQIFYGPKQIPINIIHLSALEIECGLLHHIFLTCRD